MDQLVGHLTHDLNSGSLVEVPCWALHWVWTHLKNKLKNNKRISILNVYCGNCVLWPSPCPSPAKHGPTKGILISLPFVSPPQQNLLSPRHVNPSVAKELTALEMRICWYIDYKLKKNPPQLFRYQVSHFPRIHKANTVKYHAYRSMTGNYSFCQDGFVAYGKCW